MYSIELDENNNLEGDVEFLIAVKNDAMISGELEIIGTPLCG